jgi:hypothetical protein
MNVRTLGIIIVVVGLVVAVIAAACGGGGASSTSSSSQTGGSVSSSILNTQTPEERAAMQATVEATDKAVIESAGGVVSTEERNLDVPFKLKVGQRQSVQDGGIFLNIDLVEVVEDTRCAEGSSCADPGAARIKIDVKSGGIPFGQTEMVLAGGQTEQTVKSFGKYSVGFIALDPAPGTSSGTPEYEATLVVFRSR